MPLKYLTVVFYLILARLAFCQSNSVSPDRLDELLSEMRSNTFSNATVGLIAIAGDRRAVPDLQVALTKATDLETREVLSSALIRLRETDSAYWSILSKRAQEIVDDSAPDPLVYDSDGKSIRGLISPTFLEWAKTNNLAADDALIERVMTFPRELTLLAITGDSRGLPLLRKGLTSRSHSIQLIAAEGLAQLQDKDSITAIIQAAKNAPAEIRWAIARPLVFFDDPRAQAAAEEMISDGNLLEYKKKIARAKGASGVFY